MHRDRHTKIVLMADDDPDDLILVKEACKKIGVPLELHLVTDGVELMDYLNRRGKYENLPPDSVPSLILLDLNMPRKDGREVLAELMSHQFLRLIPVVVFTTSTGESDVLLCYMLGASSYVQKPHSLTALVDTLKLLGKYWLETVELPLRGRNLSSLARRSVNDLANPEKTTMRRNC
jgi:CheY-like chemotaxis protein